MQGVETENPGQLHFGCHADDDTVSDMLKEDAVL